MTAEQIRERAQQVADLLAEPRKRSFNELMLYIESGKAFAQFETAAQLAELNDRVEQLVINTGLIANRCGL